MEAEFPAVLPVMLLDHQRIDSVSSPAWGLDQNYYPWPNCWSIEAQNGLQTIFTMYIHPDLALTERVVVSHWG